MRCLSGTEINSSPDQLIAIGFPFTSSHILPLRGGCSEVGLHTPRWGEASLPRLEGKDPSVSLPKDLLLLAVMSVYWAKGGTNGHRTLVA